MAYARSGGVNIWGEFPADTRSQWVEGAAFWLTKAGWIIEDNPAASRTGTHSSQPANNATLTVGNVVYTWKTTIDNSVKNQVARGANRDAAVANMVAAINGAAGRGTTYSTPTFQHPLVEASSPSSSQITLTYRIKGTAGNGTPSTYGALINGGYTLRGESPQFAAGGSVPLQVRVIISDQLGTVSGTRVAHMKMQGVVYSSIEKEYYVHVGAGERYRIVANRCQFWIYQEGVQALAVGSNLHGGIAWFPEASVCSTGGEVPGEVPDESWWFSSDTGLEATGTFRVSPSTYSLLRENWTTGLTDSITGVAGRFFQSTVAAFNGVLIQKVFLEAVPFCGLSMAPSTDWPNMFTGTPPAMNPICWRNYYPLIIEPFIVFASTSSGTKKRVRAQLYDAWNMGQQFAIDRVLRYDSKYFLCFNDRHKFGTIALEVPTPTPTPIEQALQNHYAF
jgi:hypothetical protein